MRGAAPWTATLGDGNITLLVGHLDYKNYLNQAATYAPTLLKDR